MTQSRPKSLPANPRRQQIVRGATELSAQDGYRGVGMRAMADEIGLSISSLYHYFRSKEDLLFGISLDVTRDFIDRHEHLLYGPGTARRLSTDLLEAHIRYFWEQRAQRDPRELSDKRAAEIQLRQTGLPEADPPSFVAASAPRPSRKRHSVETTLRR